MIDIVIVNWNAGPLLAECIRSIEAYGGGVVSKAVVVDNGSVDNSLDFGPIAIPLEIDRTRENLGFAKACNRGVARGNAPYILLLNPDARLLEGTLQQAVAFMEAPDNSRVGICGVRLVDQDKKTCCHCTRFPTPTDYFLHAAGLTRLLPRVFRSYFLSDAEHACSHAVDHVIGAFYLVRRELYEKLGGLDERFFVYLEDLDFSLRARQVGWWTWYLASAAAFHKGGGTSENVKPTRLFYSIRSRLLYSRKHFSLLGNVIVFGATLLLEPVTRLALAAVHGSLSETGDTLRGYVMIWKAAPAILVSKVHG